MIELIFVMLIIGILSSVALTRLFVNRDDAIMTKAKNTLASVRTSMALEQQKRVLRKNFNQIQSLDANGLIFAGFDGDISMPVLDYGTENCTDKIKKECWKKSADIYIFVTPANTQCRFEIDNNRFLLQKDNASSCQRLER